LKLSLFRSAAGITDGSPVDLEAKLNGMERLANALIARRDSEEAKRNFREELPSLIKSDVECIFVSLV
jgi:hypothetical protein